tara:strand:+ start:249 stop:431 length:183 start_codon:yes stop_codon:yes gene_type:complete
MKVGDLVIPSSYSNYKEIYPAKMIIEVIESERNGKPVRLYMLEGEEHSRREETLFLVSES